MTTIKAGDWCYGIRCEKCARPMAVWADLSQGRDPISFEGKGYIETACPYRDCQHMNRYQPAQVEHFRAMLTQEL